MTQSEMLVRARARLGSMTADLRRFVEAESPSADLAAIRACAATIAATIERDTRIAPEWIDVDGRVHLLWRRGAPLRAMVLAHMDTVWPLGTILERPFTVEGDIARGPGTFDMKAGIVQSIAALSLADASGIGLLVTSDEEPGSSTSRSLIEKFAREVGTVLVTEPSERGALKVARKGVGLYDLDLAGRAAHAGLEPERGINATIESAYAVLRLAGLADLDAGTTVTPTTLRSGAAGNVVPEGARLHVDVRAWSMPELERVDRGIRELSPRLEGASIRVSGGINRGPLARSASERLFSVAQACAADLGLPSLEGVGVGGGSDGNLAALAGAQTLDGLGPVGGGAHARSEHVVLSAMPERAALLAALIDAVTAAPPQSRRELTTSG